MDTEQPSQPTTSSPPPSPDSIPAPVAQQPLEAAAPVTVGAAAVEPSLEPQNPVNVQPGPVSSDTVVQQPVQVQSVSQSPEPVVSPSLMDLARPDVTVPTVSQVVGPQVSAPLQPTGGHKLPKMRVLADRRKLAVIAIALLFACISAAAVYFVLAHRNSQKEVADLEKKIAVLSADTHDLPEGAIQASECIPNMGFHYIDPESDPRFGPYYLVNKQGKVIGFEYMFNNSMLTSIPAGIDLEVLLTDGPVSLHGWQYESIEFARSPSGHPGFEDDHFDVHVYTVTPEEQKKSCE